MVSFCVIVIIPESYMGSQLLLFWAISAYYGCMRSLRMFILVYALGVSEVW